jgi:hypothetical protein
VARPRRDPMLDQIQKRRLEVLEEHFRSVVEQEFDRTLATFNGRPHYEIMATGQITTAMTICWPITESSGRPSPINGTRTFVITLPTMQS